MNIQTRQRYLANTDPQGRCYNGCHKSSELRWTEWGDLEIGVKETESRLKFWKELNDYAVSERGEGARREFRVVEE